MKNGIKNLNISINENENEQLDDEEQLHEDISFAKDQIVNVVTSISTAQSLNNNSLKLRSIKTTTNTNNKLS